MNIRVTDTGRAFPISKASVLPLLSNIENPQLRKYCAEQLNASQSETDIDATLRLVFELVSMPPALNPN